MKIFAISLVKNEADIIDYSLREAIRWADKIFVYDNGSTDNTWEIVNSLARENPQIIPWKSEAKSFSDALRGAVFNAFRQEASNGDWWCFRLDADEFYQDNPRSFLAGIPSAYHVVYSDSIEFQLTYEDLEEYSFTGNFETDKAHIQYHLPTSWSERRFFRHRNRLQWPEEEGFTVPKHVGRVYPKKIRLRHYQYRSPQQIQRRLDIRRTLYENGFTNFKHDSQSNWKDKLFSRAELYKYNEEGNFQIDGCRANHLPSTKVRLIKRILHGLKIYP